MYQIILASESPRRKEILDIMGIPYIAMASNVKEEAEETDPSKLVQALAGLKAKDIAMKVMNKNENIIVIGADTMVFYEGMALGKPRDEADAKRILRLLSDRSHDVFTGVYIVIIEKHKERSISFSVDTKVIVKPLTEEQINSYVATKEPMDKAGAYGIQGMFGIHIKEIQGDYYNVVGFPIAKIYEVLLREGIDIKK